MFRARNSLRLIALILIASAIIFGFFTRVISVFEYVTFDIGYDPDQILIGNIVMDMWRGKFPHLGMAGGGGKYAFTIPPLYFYLVFPFTILGSNPAFLVLANGLFSFLSILLFMFLIYELLEKIEFSKRLFLAGLAGFWYSTIYSEYFISNFSWNPSPIPFFLMLFTLLYKYQLETNKPLLYQSISWIIYGIVLAILVSLHSTALFVIPVVFFLSSLWFVYNNRKNFCKCLLPLLSIISSNLALLPYWRGEISSNFANSREILNTIAGKSIVGEHNNNPFMRLFKVLWDYVYLGNQVYFLGEKYFGLNLFLSIIFFSISLFFVITRYKGNRTILGFLVITWVIFLYAASNFQEEFFHFHRKILIWFAPMLFVVLSLAYLNFSKRSEKIIGLILIVLIGYSIGTNLYFDQRYLSSKYSSERLLSVSDIVEIFDKIPPQSTICYPEKKGKRLINNQYDYINTYMTKRDFNIVSECQPGNYILHPKLKMDILLNDLFPIFSLSKNPLLETNTSLILETPEAYLYRIN